MVPQTESPALRAASLPLSDLRILAIEQHGAGPFGTMQLVDLGADVIKIEKPDGGDIARSIQPFAIDEDSLYFQSLNRGKRSVTLDLANPAGYAAFLRLVAGADAVVANVRGDVPDRLRIRYADLKTVNAAVVCCFITGFGMTGPRSSEPSYDPVIQALSGWMSMTGSPDEPPTRTGLSLMDFCTGYQCAIALLAAVHAARRDRIGGECDVGMFDVGISLLSYLATWRLNRDYRPIRQERSAHASIVPFQLFTARDGWIVIGAVRPGHWLRLAAALGVPSLGTDPRFASAERRLANRAELQRELDRTLATQDVAHWCGRLREAGVACAPVRTVEEALADPLVEQRGLIIEFDHPVFGPVRTIGPAVRMGPDRPRLGAAPRLGEHTAQVLTEVGGLTAAQVAGVRAAGALGTVEAVA